MWNDEMSPEVKRGDVIKLQPVLPDELPQCGVAYLMLMRVKNPKYYPGVLIFRRLQFHKDGLRLAPAGKDIVEGRKCIVSAEEWKRNYVVLAKPIEVTKPIW